MSLLRTSYKCENLILYDILHFIYLFFSFQKMKSPEVFGQPASFTRGCEAADLCSLSLPGLQIECCSDNLCNDGGVTRPGELFFYVSRFSG